MVILTYDNIKKFEDYYNSQKAAQKLYSTECSCGSYLEMQLIPVTFHIDGYEILLSECPVMQCPNCNSLHICPNIPQEVYKSFFGLQKNGKDICKLAMRENRRFHYAEEAGYVYDSRDLSIPALAVDADPFHSEGFSCPVYFERDVLNSFFYGKQHEVEIFSESYGIIRKIGSNGWPYEWDIVFGINKYDHVIMFLGDLDQIDAGDSATHLLKAYNIPSDHCIVHTEFYQAQFNVKFSDPIKEHRIISLRSAFYERIKKKHGIELFHLEDEVKELKNRIRKPISYTETELRENMIALDGLLNEGISIKGLQDLALLLTGSLSKDDKTKTRKLLQNIIAVKEGESGAKQIIAPLFALNDLRICFAHLLPQHEIERHKTNALSVLGLSDFDDYRNLYDTMIDRLLNFYSYLNIADI